MYILPLIIFLQLFSVLLPAQGDDVEYQSADERFESEILQRLYNLFSIDTLTPSDSWVFAEDRQRSGQLFSGSANLPAPIKVVAQNETITHVGLHIFNPEEFDAYHPIAPFIESTLLKLYAKDVPSNDGFDFMLSDQVIVKVNGKIIESLGTHTTDLQDVLYVLEERRECDLTFRNFNYQFFCRSRDGSRLLVTLPADIELIGNKDKKELQDAFIDEIASMEVSKEIVMDCMDAPERSQLEVHSGRLFRTARNSLAPGLRSEYYYTKQGLSNTLTLVGIEDRSLEGISNMFTCPRASNTTIQIEHRKYGGVEETLQVYLYAFLLSFVDDHSVFVGFEEADGSRIDATIVLRSTEYTYQHIMILESVEQILDGKDVVELKGLLFTYIPNGNVEELFGTYIDHEGEKIPVKTNE